MRPVVTTHVNNKNKKKINKFISAQKNMLKSTTKAVTTEKKLLKANNAVSKMKVTSVNALKKM